MSPITGVPQETRQSPSAAFWRERLQENAAETWAPASAAAEPPLSRMLLEGFDLTKHKGEPTGAGFQGIVFGFLRADNPHLQIEIDKIRTDSKRLQRVGDVDDWEGGRLAISAEVKQFVLSADNVADLEAFGNAASRKGSLGVVTALGFAEGVRDQLEALGLLPLDRDDMLRTVAFRDLVKQRTAVASVIYYAHHVEKNSVLSRRIDSFLDRAGRDWREMRPQGNRSATQN